MHSCNSAKREKHSCRLFLHWTKTLVEVRSGFNSRPNASTLLQQYVLPSPFFFLSVASLSTSTVRLNSFISPSSDDITDALEANALTTLLAFVSASCQGCARLRILTRKRPHHIHWAGMDWQTPAQCPSSIAAAGWWEKKEGVECQFPLAQVVTHAHLVAPAAAYVHRVCYYKTKAKKTNHKNMRVETKKNSRLETMKEAA